jgi:hypothetical protein
LAIRGTPFARNRRQRAQERADEKLVHRLLDEGDLDGLADLLNECAGGRVAEVTGEGIGLIPGALHSDLGEFRRRVQEDPGGALNLVRGRPLEGIDAPWTLRLRPHIQTEIAAAAHAACRLDPENTAEYLRKGLLGAPGDTSLWIALLGWAGSAQSMPALEMAYGWARDTYATAGPGTVPTAVTREYEHWRRKLLVT